MDTNAMPMLDRLNEERVIDVTVHENKIRITEACDYYYESSFTKKELYDLIAELTYIAHNLKE